MRPNIIQIVSTVNAGSIVIVGLGDDGMLYQWYNSNWMQYPQLLFTTRWIVIFNGIKCINLFDYTVLTND